MAVDFKPVLRACRDVVHVLFLAYQKQSPHIIGDCCIQLVNDGGNRFIAELGFDVGAYCRVVSRYVVSVIEKKKTAFASSNFHCDTCFVSCT